MMKKIVFLIRDLNYGGAQRQLVTLANGLAEQGLDVSVLYFYPGGPLANDLKESHISATCLEKRGRWHLLSFFWHLTQHLKQLRPDVLHGYMGEANLLTMVLKPFFPSTQMVWGLRESDTDPGFYGWLSRVIFWLLRLLSRFTDLIIVNSQAGRVYYTAHGFAADKIVVIPNGIDVERFKPDLESRVNLRSKWGISQDTVLIGLIGRLDARKDHATFLKAAALLEQERQNVRFVCVGGGPEDYATQLYHLTNQLGIAEKVIWAGACSDMPAVHNAIDIVVSSSYSEGFPNVIGEAMACGVRCAVTNVGDSAWLVGDLGVIVPPRNPAALKDAMQHLIEKLNAHRCDRDPIRQRIVDQFSIPQLVLKTETAFLSLCHE